MLEDLPMLRHTRNTHRVYVTTQQALILANSTNVLEYVHDKTVRNIWLLFVTYNLYLVLIFRGYNNTRVRTKRRYVSFTYRNLERVRLKFCLCDILRAACRIFVIRGPVYYYSHFLRPNKFSSEAEI